MENEEILCARNVDAFWGKKQILHHISFSLKKGDFMCLTGANGSGKSTLLSIMAGMIPNISVSIGSVPLLQMKRRAIAKCIAYMMQTEHCVWNYTVQDAVLLGRYAHSGGFYTKSDYMVTERVLEEVQIDSLKQCRLSSLSGGEWQKVRIARALCQEPSFLLLDEPVANLDFSYQEELLLLLKKLSLEKKVGVLMSIHDINTASRFADTMLLLSKNHTTHFIGTVSDIMVTDVLEEAYGTPFGIFLHPEYMCPQAYCKIHGNL